MQMEHSRNMFGPSTYGSFQSFYSAPSFGQPQSEIGAGPCVGSDTAATFPSVSDVFYRGGGSGTTGPQRLGYDRFDNVQPAADSDFPPPYFPPPNPAAAQPVPAAAGVFFAHHRQAAPVINQHQQPAQLAVDQSVYWSPINAAGFYVNGTASANARRIAADVDQQKTYHALQQVYTLVYSTQVGPKDGIDSVKYSAALLLIYMLSFPGPFMRLSYNPALCCLFLTALFFYLLCSVVSNKYCIHLFRL